MHLQEPQQSLKNVVSLLRHHDELFNDNLPMLADIGLCQLDAKSTRTVVAPTPKQRIAEIQKMIPAVISQRNEDAKTWVKEQCRKLDKRVETVEEFVEQSNNYTHISESFQEQRDKVALYGEFYSILEQNDFLPNSYNRVLVERTGAPET